MDYALLAIWCFAVALAGGLVGLVLGNIRLPAVLLLSSSPGAGTGANIGVSAIAAATASIAHIRAGRVNWRLFGWMAPPSLVGALAGGYLSGVLPGDVLLVAIAAVLLYSGVQLLRKPEAKPRSAEQDGLDIPAAIVSGLVIGLLGGVVGLILGTLRMPALIRIVGEVPARAVGTNVTIGSLVGVAGVIGHLPSEPPDWDVLAVGAAASVPGALLGSRLTGRLSDRALLQAVGYILLVAAAAMVVDALT
jgi:uncharacterized membrane protein YfcA